MPCPLHRARLAPYEAPGKRILGKDAELAVIAAAFDADEEGITALSEGGDLSCSYRSIPTFLWAAIGAECLSDAARDAIEDRDNDVFISAAVAWEIVIKHAEGKVELPLSPSLYVTSRLEEIGFRELPISRDHAPAAASFPPIHADLFDRIMIAQAQCASMTFVTRDPRALRYHVAEIAA